MSSIFTHASFTLVPRVDTEREDRGESSFFAPQRPELTPKPEENGHEEEGLLRTEAPVADGGE